MLNDEPTRKDQLNRTAYARAFAELATESQTPLVVGVYGKWGSGKTSLMQLVEEHLDRERTRVVWFDPWRHQFDDQPVLALLHSLIAVIDPGQRPQAVKLVKTIAGALGGFALNKTTGMKLSELKAFGEQLEDQVFEVREKRTRLREYFSSLVEHSCSGGKRLIFFIDDLDRCMPPYVLNILESLKLYLNIRGCVFFLGVDREALELSVRHQYGELAVDERQYLEKIVTLPFNIPPVAPAALERFIERMLPRSLTSCRDFLCRVLGSNPRRVKRTINTLSLSHKLADASGIQDYNPQHLALLIWLQERDPRLWSRVEHRPGLLSELSEETSVSDSLREEFLGDDALLRSELELAQLPGNLEKYTYLASALSADVELSAKVNEEYSAAEKMFMENLNWIDRVSEIAARRVGVPAADVADAVSAAKLKLIEDDFAVLRKFKGRSRPQTYLSVVIQRLMKDYQIAHMGRWRPSAVARREGVAAVQLETLLYRDGFSLDEAIRSVQENSDISMTEEELIDLAGRLPQRSMRVHVDLDDEDLFESRTPEIAAMAADAVRTTNRIRQILTSAREEMAEEQQQVLDLIVEGASIEEMSRILGIDRRKLYTLRDRILRNLRDVFENEGLLWKDVLESLDRDD